MPHPVRNTIVSILLLIIGVTAQATPQPPAPSGREWPDTLTLSRGQIVPCRIRNVTTTALTIEYPRSGTALSPTLTREVPWTDIQAADFSMDPEFHRLVASSHPLKDTPRLADLWRELAPLLGRAHHPAGDVGLTLARLSLNHPDAGARHRALPVCRAIAEADWNPVRRHHARLLIAQILAALGRTEPSLEEARRLASEPDITPEVAMPAHLLLAEADFAALRTLEEANPRWIDDDVVKPEREALFHRALDAALKPSLFHGAIEPPASLGMWAAVQLLEFNRQVPAAAECARDLLKLYPASPRASEATAFLHRHRLPLDPEAPPEEASPPMRPPLPRETPLSTASPDPVVHRRPRYAPAPQATERTEERPPVSSPSPPHP